MQQRMTDRWRHDTLKPEERWNPAEHCAYFFPFILRDLGNFRGQYNSSSRSETSKDLGTSAQKYIGGHADITVFASVTKWWRSNPLPEQRCNQDPSYVSSYTICRRNSYRSLAKKVL